MRYEDDIFVLAKQEDIGNIMEQFNFSDKSILFTSSRFEISILRFLDIKMVVRWNRITKLLNIVISPFKL